MSLNENPLLPPGLEVPEGRTIASRRAYMAAVFKFHGPYSDEKMAEARSRAIKLNCAYLHQKAKVTQMGQMLFEYMADNAIWHNWFVGHRTAGKPAPKWPWTGVRPDLNDLSEGISPVYAQWLRDNVPIEMRSGETPDLASDEKTASTAPKTPVAPAAGSSEQPPAVAKDEPEPESAAAEPELEQEYDDAESDAAQSEAIAAQPEAELKAAEDKPGPGHEVASAPSSEPASHELVFRPKTEAKRTLPPAQGLSASRWAPPPVPLVALNALPPKATPPVPRGSMVCPPVPSLAARQHVWKAKYGDGLRDEPVCGPFEVRIPCWIEFEELIWGHNGQTFAKVQGLIHRDLAISWEDEKPTSGGQDMSLPVDYEGRPCKLIVGFSKGVDHTNGPNQSLLLALWDKILGWAGLSHVGTSMTLAEHLGVNQANQDAAVISTTSGPRSAVRALYKQGEENNLSARQAARKEKAAVGQWQREVHQILQNPIEVATERLTAWVYAGDEDMDLRITVAERVWVTSVSDPVKVAQGGYWAHCLRFAPRAMPEI